MICSLVLVKIYDYFFNFYLQIHVDEKNEVIFYDMTHSSDNNFYDGVFQRKERVMLHV